MRVRTLVLVGTTALTLAVSAAFVPGAGASTTSRPSASLAAGHHGKVVAPHGIALSGKCHTVIGTPLSTVDGIISWNGSGIDAAGAADFKCSRNSTRRARTFRTVTVNGYYGDAGSSTFNVTVYRNLGGEPNNGASPVCATQTVTGSPTGAAYPTNDTTVITLNTACTARRGVNWLEVQALSSTAWYWEVQQEQHGYEADWRDTNGSYGTPCTPGYQDGFYMQDCIFGGDVGYDDFMFIVR
jgi:hypothetical protein